MSIRYSGLASRSFIIGSRLCPPAISRASGPMLCSAAIAPSTRGRALVLKRRGGLHSYLLELLVVLEAAQERQPGFHHAALGGPGSALARVAPTATGIRLRTPGDSLGSYWTGESVPITGERGIACGRVCLISGYSAARGEAAVRGVAQRRTVWAGGRDRGLPTQPGQRQRALRIDLADPRGLRLLAVREVAEALAGGARVEPLDEADGVLHAGLLDEQALEQARRPASRFVLIEVTTSSTGRALLDDPDHAGDRVVEVLGDPLERDDRRHEVVDDRRARSAGPR